MGGNSFSAQLRFVLRDVVAFAKKRPMGHARKSFRQSTEQADAQLMRAKQGRPVIRPSDK